MRPMRAKAILLACILAANLALAGGPGARGAYACDCAEIQSPAEGLRSSDAVFSGEVTGFGAEDPNPRDDVPLGGVRFGVEAWWKGISGNTAVIHGQGQGYFGTAEEGEMLVLNTCDVTFERGSSYLVYAYHGEGDGDETLRTDICTATKHLSDADEDLRVLGSPSATLPDTGGVPLFLLVAAVVALILAGALVARRGGGSR